MELFNGFSLEPFVTFLVHGQQINSSYMIVLIALHNISYVGPRIW